MNGRARRIDSALLAVAMAGIIAAIGAYALIAEHLFRAQLVPELDAAAQSVGRSTAALIVRAVDAGVPYNRLTRVGDVLASTLKAHPELSGIAVDAGNGALHAQAGTIPAEPYRAATPIVVRGHQAGTITLGIDSRTIDGTLRDLVLDLAAILIVALFLAAELFQLAAGTNIGRRLVEPTLALERALAGTFDMTAAAVDPRIAALHVRSAEIERALALRFARRAQIGRASVAAATAALRAVRERFRFEREVARADAGLRAVRAPLFVFMLAEAMTRPFMPLVATALPRPGWIGAAAAASAPLTVFLLVVALAQPFVLPWSHRIGRRPALIAGAALGALAFAVAAAAPSLAVLIAARALGGLGYGIVFAAAQGYVLDRAPAGERAAGLAMFVGAIMVAELCGPSVGGLLAERAGNSVAFVVCACLALIAAVLAMARLAPVAGDPKAEWFAWRDLRALVVSPRLGALLFAAAVPQKIALTGLAFFIVPVGSAALGQRPATAGLLLMVYAVLMVLLTGPAAALADRFDKRRTFVGAGLVLSGVAGLLPLLLPSLAGLIVMVVALGLGQALGIASQSALVGELAPRGTVADDNRVYAVFRLVERLGNAFGPPVAAFVLTRAGYPTAAAALGGLLLACSLCFFAVMLGSRRSVEQLAYRAAIFILALGALGTLTATAPRPYTIYMITYRGPTDVERGFTDELAREHVPVTYVERDVNLDARRVVPLLAEIRRLHPDLVYTWGTPVTLAVAGTYQKPDPAVAGVPVLFTMVAAPVAVGLVPSLAAPGRNVTGVYHVAPLEEQLAAMRAYRPFSRVGALYTASASNSVEVVDELERDGKRDGFSVIAVPFAATPGGRPTLDGLAGRIAAIRHAGAQWLYLPPDSFLGDSLTPILADAEHELLPTWGTTQQMTDAGVLAGVVAPYYGIGQLTAVFARKILVDRVPPQKLPVATLQRFTYVVSMGLARRLEIFPPLPLFRYVEVSQR